MPVRRAAQIDGNCCLRMLTQLHACAASMLNYSHTLWETGLRLLLPSLFSSLSQPWSSSFPACALHVPQKHIGIKVCQKRDTPSPVMGL